MKASIDTLTKPLRGAEETGDEDLRGYSHSYVSQIVACAIRCALVYVRDPSVYRTHIFRSIFLSLVVGSMFYQLSLDQGMAHIPHAHLLASVITYPTLLHAKR